MKPNAQLRPKGSADHWRGREFPPLAAAAGKGDFSATTNFDLAPDVSERRTKAFAFPKQQVDIHST